MRQDGVRFTDALDLQHGLAEGRYAHYYRCGQCHFLDKAEFFAGRLKAKGYACRRCHLGTTFYDPPIITDDERRLVQKGFYRDPDF